MIKIFIYYEINYNNKKFSYLMEWEEGANCMVDS